MRAWTFQMSSLDVAGLAARVKDVLEDRLAAEVCAGRVDLVAAQRELSGDWIAAYRRGFRTDVPLRAHLDQGADEPELEIAAPRRPRIGAYAETIALMTLPVSRPYWHHPATPQVPTE